MPLFRFKPKKGFTLIELMVSITILAIISTVGFATYSNSQKLGRDAKRKQDLRTIAVALDLYRQQNGRYPCGHWELSNAADPWIYDYDLRPWGSTICDGSKPAFDRNYIQVLPKDPLETGGVPWTQGGYHYGYRAFECKLDGQFFILITQLENPNDPDRIQAKNQKWCDGTNNIYTLVVSAPTTFVVLSPSN